MSRDDLDFTIDRYLEGELILERTTDLQERLASPAFSDALSRELFVRDFLTTLPPEAPPAGLVERLQRALPAARGGSEEAAKPVGSLWETSRAALAGARWAVAGPSLALTAPLGSYRKPEAARPERNVATSLLRVGATSGKVLHLGAASGKALRIGGASSGAALRLGAVSGKALRFGAWSGRALGIGASSVAGALKKRSEPRPWWRRLARVGR